MKNLNRGWRLVLLVAFRLGPAGSGTRPGTAEPGLTTENALQPYFRRDRRALCFDRRVLELGTDTIGGADGARWAGALAGAVVAIAVGVAVALALALAVFGAVAVTESGWLTIVGGAGGNGAIGTVTDRFTILAGAVGAGVGAGVCTPGRYGYQEQCQKNYQYARHFT